MVLLHWRSQIMQITDLAYIDGTGYHYADYPAYLSWLQDVYKTIYGADVYLEADSQDGQFVALIAKALYDTAALGSATMNSFSPVSAQGAGLARVVKINGIEKRSPTYSTVDIDITGALGTLIDNGVVIDILNQKWNVPTVTIPGSGAITVTATAQEKGSIRAEANTVNRIYTPTRGWLTVNNPLAATAGVGVELDAELRNRQSVSTANPSLTVMEGTVGAVENVSGVTRVRGYENDTGVTDGNGIPAHKISLIVEGGDAMEIAQTIAKHKTPGTGTYGTTSELVYDSKGMPLTIMFYRPTQKAVKARITLDTFPGYSATYDDLIKTAVSDAINAFGIGNDALITKLYVPANLSGDPVSDTYDVALIEIAFVADSFGTANLSIAFNEVSTCTLGDVTIVV